MKHPHDPLIRAWLDGRTVQYLQGDLWIDMESPSTIAKMPHFYPDCSYRLKPLALRYRLGVLDGQVVCANTLMQATVLERRGTTWVGGVDRGDPVTQFRVWPDGTCQCVDDGDPPYEWMSDDYMTVWATTEAEAIQNANPQPFNPNCH